MKYKSEWSNPAYDAGWSANRNGQSRDSNPNFSGYDFDEWNQGWDDATASDRGVYPSYRLSRVRHSISSVGNFVLSFLGYSFLVVLVVSYLMAIARWFMTDHFAFWHGFKELIWALAPIINITYVWDLWLKIIMFPILLPVMLS